jgi:membrane protease YdiL (CAAX protease family)
MTANWKSLLLGGFADSAPPPVASWRHLRRFVYIAIGIGLLMLLQARRSAPAPIASRVPLYFALIAVELVLGWFVAIGVHARGVKLTDLIGRRWRTALNGFADLLLACGTAALLRFSGPLLFRLLGRWSSQTGFLLPASHLETAVWILVSLVAGVCEELVFRGYLQRQLWSLTRSLPLGLLLQSVIFGFGHIYQGCKPATVTAIYGLVFGLVAAWRRSIIPGALAHALVDVIGGLKL